MEYLVVCAAAVVASTLTLFSGFGLGTLLLPTFALFFPIATAVAMTAIVHLLNNLFKLVLVGRHASPSVATTFGIPAIAASFLGALLLVRLSDMGVIASYDIADSRHDVTPVGLVIALLMVAFAIVELSPRLERVSMEKRYLPLGGALSGFFGGLSGHQGALRSVFLLKSGLSKTGFIGTGVVIACAVDLVRISVYSSRHGFGDAGAGAGVVAAAVVAAFAGAFVGSRFIHKVSMRFIRRLVAVMLLAIAVGLGSGLF
jgi:uncharacterized membrane protein YfcA